MLVSITVLYRAASMYFLVPTSHLFRDLDKRQYHVGVYCPFLQTIVCGIPRLALGFCLPACISLDNHYLSSRDGWWLQQVMPPIQLHNNKDNKELYKVFWITSVFIVFHSFYMLICLQNNYLLCVWYKQPHAKAFWLCLWSVKLIYCVQ